ncbi:hypothetical protein F7725_016062 [Dissostichus mawsoni]|uniref:Uncharacterized protein n=1 Tax=Dissostichus mawsoni TaxID=36200 RepID=A0A7J5Y3J2_DISMA|nr:hypothetical protein F7725_016062 [Dissostichus mawsoni]
MWWSDPVLRNVLHVQISGIVTHLLYRVHPWGRCCGPAAVTRGQSYSVTLSYLVCLLGGGAVFLGVLVGFEQQVDQAGDGSSVPQRGLVLWAQGQYLDDGPVVGLVEQLDDGGDAVVLPHGVLRHLRLLVAQGADGRLDHILLLSGAQNGVDQRLDAVALGDLSLVVGVVACEVGQDACGAERFLSVHRQFCIRRWLEPWRQQLQTVRGDGQELGVALLQQGNHLLQAVGQTDGHLGSFLVQQQVVQRGDGVEEHRLHGRAEGGKQRG